MFVKALADQEGKQAAQGREGFVYGLWLFRRFELGPEFKEKPGREPIPPFLLQVLVKGQKMQAGVLCPAAQIPTVRQIRFQLRGG